METVKWCIIYEDGTTFSDIDGGPADAPVERVQFIAQYNDANGWEALCNFPFYVWDYRDGVEKWYCASESGRENYMREEGWRKVLIGSWIGDKRYEELHRWVTEKLQFSKKVGYAWWEWHPE